MNFMESKEGHVFIARAEKGGERWGHVIFGKGVEPEGPYRNIESNFLTPFASLEEAVQGAVQFDIERDFIGNSRVADFRLLIAANAREAEEVFRGAYDLVVVEQWLAPGEFRLIGEYAPGKFHVTADRIASYLRVNCLSALNAKLGESAFQRAIHIASEVNRQHENAPVRIAQLYLRAREDSPFLIDKALRERND